MSKIGSNGFPKSVSTETLIRIAREIGHELLKRQADVVAVASNQMPASQDVWATKKPDGSSLTSSDIWANNEILARLKELPINFDQIGVISEESEKDSNKEAAKKAAAFVIDPLDNTGDYKRGKDSWSVTLGFIENGIPTGGVVYYPAQGRLFYTHEDGKSYFLNEKTQADPVQLSGAISKNPDNTNQPIHIVTDFEVAASLQTPKGIQVVNDHAAHTDRYWQIAMPDGTDLAEHGDLFYAWDVVGPAAIAARANVVYADRHGQPLNYLERRAGYNDFELPREGFIAGNRQTMQSLLNQ